MHLFQVMGVTRLCLQPSQRCREHGVCHGTDPLGCRPAGSRGAWVSRPIPVACTSTLPNGKAICEGRAPMHWHGDSFAAHGRSNETHLEAFDLARCVRAQDVDNGAVDGLEGLMARALAFTIASCVLISILLLTRCLYSSPACGRRSVRVWQWGFQMLTDRPAVPSPTRSSASRRRVVQLVRRATIQVG